MTLKSPVFYYIYKYIFMIILKTDKLYFEDPLTYEDISKSESPKTVLRWMQMRIRLKNKALYTNIFI